MQSWCPKSSAVMNLPTQVTEQSYKRNHIMSQTTNTIESRYNTVHFLHIDGLVQERRNPSANAMELHFSCTNPSIWNGSGEFGSWSMFSCVNGKSIQCRVMLVQGLCSPRRHRVIGIGIPILNLRRSSDRLRFIMGVPIPVKHSPFSE